MLKAKVKRHQIEKIKEILGAGPRANGLERTLSTWDLAGINQAREVIEKYQKTPALYEVVEFLTEVDTVKPADNIALTVALAQIHDAIIQLQGQYATSYLRHDTTMYSLEKARKNVFAAREIVNKLITTRPNLERLCKDFQSDSRPPLFEYATETDLTSEEGNAMKAMLEYPQLTETIRVFHLLHPRLRRTYSEETRKQIRLAFGEIGRIPFKHPQLDEQAEENKFIRSLNNYHGKDHDWEARQKARYWQRKIIGILGLR